MIGKKHSRGPKALLLLLIAAGGAIAIGRKDVMRYLRMRSM